MLIQKPASWQKQFDTGPSTRVEGTGNRSFGLVNPSPLCICIIYIGVNARIKILKLEAQRVNILGKRIWVSAALCPWPPKGFPGTRNLNWLSWIKHCMKCLLLLLYVGGVVSATTWTTKLIFFNTLNFYAHRNDAKIVILLCTNFFVMYYIFIKWQLRTS